MYDENWLKREIEKIHKAERKLAEAEKDVIEAYREQWNDMNHMIDEGLWPEKAMFKANAYGIKLDEEMYVFQLDAALPFIPNPFYHRFSQYQDDFVAASLLICPQLRDVIEKLADGPMSQPAALVINHHYNGQRKPFAMHNKAKQVLMNTFRQKLIADDSWNSISSYSEKKIRDTENRTVLYLGPETKRLLMETDIASRYPQIDHIPGVISCLC